MKFRCDFVTNSSSASYIIDLDNLSERQLYLIQHYKEVCARIQKAVAAGAEFPYEPGDTRGADWTIETKDGQLVLRGWTDMSFSMRAYLGYVVKVPNEDIEAREF